MGLLDGVIGNVMGSLGQDLAPHEQQQHSDMLGGLMDMMNSEQMGGLSGIVQKFG